MRRVLLLVIGALAVVAIATTTSVTGKSTPIRTANAGPAPWNGARTETEGPQSFLDLAAASGEPVTQAALQRAAAQADALPEATSTRWQFVGPSNIGGRVTDLAIDPTTTPSTVFAAVGSGG